jgi:hypothetical protein
MLAAKQLLGRAGSRVQLIAVNANPSATGVSDVMAYSRSHSMVNQWDFLTGSRAASLGLSPRDPVKLPELPAGSLMLGPGKPRLVVFFATWLETGSGRAAIAQYSWRHTTHTAAVPNKSASVKSPALSIAWSCQN